jgi:hypothetical protein
MVFFYTPPKYIVRFGISSEGDLDLGIFFFLKREYMDIGTGKSNATEGIFIWFNIPCVQTEMSFTLSLLEDTSQ